MVGYVINRNFAKSIQYDFDFQVYLRKFYNFQ